MALDIAPATQEPRSKAGVTGKQQKRSNDQEKDISRPFPPGESRDARAYFNMSNNRVITPVSPASTFNGTRLKKTHDSRPQHRSRTLRATSPVPRTSPLTVRQEDTTGDDDDEYGDSTFLTGLFTPAKGDGWTRPADTTHLDSLSAPEQPQSSPRTNKRPVKKQSTLSMSVGEYFQILSNKRQSRMRGESNNTAAAHLFPSQAIPILNPKPIEIMCAHQRSIERKKHSNLDFNCYTSRAASTSSTRSSLDGNKVSSADQYRAQRASSRMVRFTEMQKGRLTTPSILSVSSSKPSYW